MITAPGSGWIRATGSCHAPFSSSDQTAPGRGCLAIGLNPGLSGPHERTFYVNSGMTYDRVKTYRDSISGKRFFALTRRVVDQLGLSGPILWSNLAKCENESGRKGLPPLQTLRHCTRRFLRRELDAVPIDWVVFGIGWESYRALAYLVPERSVIGFPHPTGGYRDFRKILDDGQLRQEIKDRAKGILSAREPGTAWLGSINKSA